MKNKNGVIYGLLSYFLWGILPIYWSSIKGVDAFEILANRIVWALIFMIIVLVVLGKWGEFLQEVKNICLNRKKLLTVIGAGITILFNWGIFIWAVSQGRIIETSMGYYINPLVSVLFGVVFLGESLDLWSKGAVALAAIGVGVMIFNVGVFPWISLSLALTFAFYGLLKKTLVVDTKTSILLETLVVLPLALGYIYYLSTFGRAAWQHSSTTNLLLLFASGPVTAIPLLLFTAAAKLLPLSFIGFLQYLAPTLSLIIGVFIYGEAFTFGHLLSFGWIWAGLLVFTLNQFRSK
ncbi:MAG: EamA family transporter RarD [Acidaminococcaceae bacterium]|nr:EamA family transporter RarD [Acidaminococcaceae bacterium]MDD4721427.1 EamA family transporter RarD [Acidaminococcaceae bacterium]